MSEGRMTEVLTCQNCGIPLTGKQTRFCSERCRRKKGNHRQKLKNLVFDHYGWACACCGESVPEFLTIDHIEEDGASHRRDTRTTSGGAFYGWLLRQYKTQGQWPAGFQTLCRNCNFGKHISGGICPHEKQEGFVRFDMRGWRDEGPDYEAWEDLE